MSIISLKKRKVTIQNNGLWYFGVLFTQKNFFSLLNLYQLTSWRQTLKSWLLTRDSMTKLQILDQDILSTFMNHDEVRFINYCWWIERGRINKYNLSIYLWKRRKRTAIEDKIDWLQKKNSKINLKKLVMFVWTLLIYVLRGHCCKNFRGNVFIKQKNWYLQVRKFDICRVATSNLNL